MKQLECIYLNGGVSFHEKRVALCCHPATNGGSPTACDFTTDVDAVLEATGRKRLALKRALMAGERCECTDCSFTYDGQHDPQYALSALQFNQCSICQLRCKYCWLVKDNAFTGANVSMLPLVDKLVERSLLSPTALITWAGGEPTLMIDFDNMLSLLPQATHLVYSNGVKYCEFIVQHFNASSQLWVSLDAGTPATYVAVHGKDYFREVVLHLALYAHVLGARLYVKYVLCDVNDNMDEVKHFVDCASWAFPEAQLVFDRDHHDTRTSYVALLSAIKREFLHATFHTHFFSPEEKQALL